MFKWFLYFLFLILNLELLSYFILNYFLPNKHSTRLEQVLGKSENISWQMPDLWSNYKPNSASRLINKFGYRYGGGREKKYRILCIGGSDTWGDGVEHGYQSYPARLEEYLIKNKYDIEIINCGLPYYSSAEVLASFCFRDIHLDPDLIIVSIGINDLEPFMSPKLYKPDYSHWRVLGNASNNAIFKEKWEGNASNFIRLIYFYFLKPGYGGHAAAIQLTGAKESMLAETDLFKIKHRGLIMNFLNIVDIALSKNIRIVTVLVNNDLTRENSIIEHMELNKTQKLSSINRTHLAVRLTNTLLDSLSKSRNIHVIPFNEWEPNNEQNWVDHCHLDSVGINEKAEFIGKYLISNGIITNSLE